MSDAPHRRSGKRSLAARAESAAATSAESTATGNNAVPADPDAPSQRGRPRRSSARVLTDGRVQMLVYLPPALVKTVKRIALDDDTSASAVVEQALAEWLARRTDPLR